MTLAILFDKFDEFVDAPDGVAKIRDLVLEFAIQGKLIAQNTDDEPAFKQLERIAINKGRLGRVARVNSFSTGTPALRDTRKYLPPGWAKASLADLVTVLNGRAYSKDELLATGTPVLRVGNLFTSNQWYYSDLELEPDKYCDRGDLIFAWSASFGPFIWAGPKVIYHYHIWKLELHSEEDLSKDYLYWFLQNRTQEIKRAGHGVSMLHMTKAKMERLEVMIPPLAEQKRIVAKVSEFMTLCDQLEAQQRMLRTRRIPLARAALARFSDAPTPTNLLFLFNPSFDIPPSDLRKSILALAVQGKLVPQDRRDVPARLSFPHLAARSLENDADALPESWLRVPLGKVGEWRGGGTPSTSRADFWEGELPWVSPKDMKLLHISDAQEHISEAAAEGSPAKPIPSGALLMVVRGMILARAFPVALTTREVAINQDMKALLPRYPETRDYLLVALRALEPEALAAVEHSSHGTCKLRTEYLQDISIPIPPLGEQRRIVAKVEELMALVDALETQLSASRAAVANLLSALVAELTGQDERRL
jgi:type I restriction enzyme S subunit